VNDCVDPWYRETMAKRQSRAPATSASFVKTFNAFSVVADNIVEKNMLEGDAWNTFLRWCGRVPIGTRVELLRGTSVIAWLNSAGVRRLPEDASSVST
jgi:hypothetical protein